MSTRSNTPFVPSFMKAVAGNTKPVIQTYADADLSNSNHAGNTSFKYDPLDSPLKSSQQLNVDWSKFENHTFFSSAEVKVNEAFNKIINGFPFDGTRKEVEEYLDSMTGFEKYVFDSFPTWSGALHFSGTSVTENPAGGFQEKLGTWIAVKDKSGNLYPEMSKNNEGVTIINPADEETSMSIEAIIRIPELANDTQVIFQKSSTDTDGFMFHLSPSVSSTSATAVFSVTSGSISNSVSYELLKGSPNHVCVILNKEGRENSLQFYLNESLQSETTKNKKFGKLSIDESDFLIGSGSTFYSGGILVTPTQTFSGSLDELRIFHSVRDTQSQILQSSRGLYSTPDLKLYYRFNEPSGTLSNLNSTTDAVVLDSSGNSLHSTIQNYDASLRLDATADSDNILVNERKEFKTVLFPTYEPILELNLSLLTEATKYDRENPNNIIKLIPKHYLLEGASQDGFYDVEGDAGNPYAGDGVPGQGKKGSVQLILSFLYIWSKFFDEIKLYADAFSTLRTVGYDETDTIPDNFLEDLVRQYGFYLPKFFTNSTVEQYADGQYIPGLTDLATPLKKIQSIILRRVLTNMPDIIRSKGTQHSIKSFLRSVGIDPENSIKIREYGGATTKQLSASREKKFEPLGMVNFITSSFVITQPLSGSRIEPGFPKPAGSFITSKITKRNTGTTNRSDGLFTSGSWNVEGFFKFTPQKISEIVGSEGNQSLFRMIVTGSTLPSQQPALLANVVATQGSGNQQDPATVELFCRPTQSSSAKLLHMSLSLSGSGIFDGDRWNVSFGCIRNDEFDSRVTSSYYLRVGRADEGEILDSYVTSSYFDESITGQNNLFRTALSGTNASGSYICIGNNQVIPAGIGYSHLNDTLYSDDIARTVDFEGWAAGIRFWSKSMTVDEWKEHVRNPKSTGVDDPMTNFNFVTDMSGSFQKLRLDTFHKQPIRDADDNGNIVFADFSQNNNEPDGTGFEPNSHVVIGDIFRFSYLSPAFDESATDDKIRIKSFTSPDLLNENPFAVPSPSYLSNDYLLSEEPQDDLRLSLEFSMIDSLDRDIVSMFSSFDILNDVLGSPELMFSADYPGLDVLRDVYFNRLSDKVDFRKFLEFYRWFDISISGFIEQLIPSKTRYKGTNFVIESHMLERHKNTYRHSDNYIGQKQIIDDSLLVQQIVGVFRKY